MPETIERQAEEKEELTPEEEAKRGLARKRLFYTLLALTAALIILIGCAIVEHVV